MTPAGTYATPCPSPMPKQKAKSIHPVAHIAREILYALVRHPDELKINDRLIGTILAIEVEAHEEDRPKLIGSQGKHIGAFTRILKAIGIRHGLKVVVDLIVPPNPPKHSHQQPFTPNPNWQSEWIARILRPVCDQLLGRHDYCEHKLKNMTVYQLGFRQWEMPGDVLAALDIMFEAIGYRQGHVVHITGPERK